MLNKLLKTLGIVLFFGGNFGYHTVLAQNIIPNNDGVNTNVNFDSLNNTFNIDGGTTSGNNLFHSFQEFGLDNGQVANFLSQPNIVNILSRINGGNPSIINGIINSNANLFLMNPAGIIFGQNASLNINGDFTATTATGIGFEGGFFNNIGTNDYNNLIGNPISYKFDQKGGIIYNASSLQANNLALFGNNIINQGNLTAINGNILVSGVSEKGLLTVSFPNSLISWEISAPTNNDGILTVENFLNAIKGKTDLGVTVHDNNQFFLGNFNLNITPKNGQIISTGDINIINNSEINSPNITLNAGENIRVIGDINSASENGISGTVNIISETGNITLNKVDIGSNTGVDNPLNINTSGEVQLLGELTPRGATVNIGNDTPVSNFIVANFINTQGGDFNLNTSVNYTFNTNLFTLGGNTNIISNGDLTINSNLQTSGGDINFNSVNLDITNSNLEPNGGNVNLTATNDIIATDINTQGGDINIKGADITLNKLVTSDDLNEVTRSSGNVDIQGNNISLSSIDTRTTVDSNSGINAGNINLIAENNININGNNSEGDIISSSVSVGGLGNAGNINIQSDNGDINFAENFFLISATTPTDNPNNSGEISLNAANGEINLPENLEIRNFSNSGNSAPFTINANSINGTDLSLVIDQNIDLANLNLSGNLDVLVNKSANITNSQSIKILGELNIINPEGNILLNNPNNDFNTVTIFTNQETVLNDVNNIVLNEINSDTVDVTANNINQSNSLVTNSLNLTATDNINLSDSNNKITNLNATGNNITINNAQNIILNNITSNNSVNINTIGNISQNAAIISDNVNFTASGEIKLENNQNQIGQYNLFANNVILTNPNNININQIVTNGGDIRITGNNITAENSLLSNGGNIQLMATENINTQEINSRHSLDNSQNIATSGQIYLQGKNIITGDILSFGQQGADIIVNAQNTITTGAIDSSGSIGDGGNVTLDPTGDIEVISINSQGGDNGQGGDVNIQTDSFFRATGTILDSNLSISTVGGTGGGDITIEHGGKGQTPFVIGDATINGTAGIINSGRAEFNNGSFLFTTKKENIDLISVNQIPLDINPQVTMGNDNDHQEETESNTIDTSVSTLTRLSTVPIKTIDQTTRILGEIQSNTGAKPALIYVSFTPKNVSLNNDFASKEQNLTNDFEQYINPKQKTANPMISVEEQDSDVLDLVVVTQGETLRYTIEDATRDKVLQLNSILRIEINRPDHSEKRLLAASQKLYEWLIKPLESDLNRLKINNLVFVMDEGLRSLPLAALHDENGYIIEKYSVGLMPSISLVDTNYTPIQELPILAMGADTFTDQNPLPAVPTELNIITQQIWKGQSFLNQDFTVNKLIETRKNNPVAILHLATHGEFNPGKPENSYIEFSDRRLTLDQLPQLRLNRPPIELMVLSACKTALGDNDAELGFAGLAYQAGVKTALGSLWYVSDEGTLGLMSSFYQNLLTTKIKAEALRQAQLGMLKGEVRIENGRLISGDRSFDLPKSLENVQNKDLKHPFYWSAFTMIGNPW